MDNNTNNNRLENEEATHQEENQTPQTVRAEHNDNINEQPAQNAAADDRAQNSPAEKQQVSGEYSWVNPNYAPQTGQTNTSGQGQQGSAPNTGSYTYNPYGQQNAQSRQPQQPQQAGQYRNPYSSAGGGFSAYSGQPGYTSYQGGAYGAPYQPQPQNQAKARKAKRAGVSGRVLALVVVVCIVVSSLFGMGGAYYVNRNMTNDTPSILAPRTGDETGLSYQAVPSEVSGTTDSENAIVNAVQKAKNSVVEISTESVSTHSFFGQFVTQGAGSGVIISTDGYIITCDHVISGASTITVMLADGTKHDAQVIGTDDQNDIAIIKINATGLSAAVLGDSDALKVGQTAIAIGNPLGELGGTVTVGYISALDREVTIDGQYYTLLQTDAAINPGNSGGGLFDISGNLIGIVNAKSSGTEIEGLGFSIPINTAKEISDQLIEYGYVKGRVMLGIYIVEVNANTSTSSLYQSGNADLINYITDYGVYFVQYQDSYTGDLKYGDRIVAIEGITVSSRVDVTNILKDYSAGDTIKVTVARLTGTGRIAQSKMVDVDVKLYEYVPETAQNN
jgi:serine protease Do